MRRTYRSFAKLNLHLQVVGRRADGYHELRTLFQTIELHDELTVEPAAAGGVQLAVEGADLPVDGRNLAWRAAAGFLERWAPGTGVRLGLRKRVPVGGGLGGGSSNAATVLVALQETLGGPAPPEEMRRLAAELGADVPYFLVGGTALGLGRGDEVQPLPELPAADVWLAVPAVEVSTAAVFAALGPVTPRPLDPAIAALAAGRVPSRWTEIPPGNDLQDAVFAGFPAVARVYNALVGAGAETVRLSGSGATLFAAFPDPEAAREAARGLPPGCRFERTRFLSRSSLAAARRVESME
jgi:4-diphosphocytidyl-2-C-methyl-D-erythritol kinase